MLGKITITQSNDIKLHTYTAPEEGWHVNTHLVELPTQLLAIDAQYTLPFAREVVAYAETLRKPITRLYISHYHPDHVLGADAFSAPAYALPEVQAKIEAVGDRVAAEEHEKRGDVIPKRARRPDQVVMPGAETIDRVRFEFMLLQHAETENALTIGLPGHRILITQDLIYNNVHVFLGERAFDTWATALQRYKKLPYEKLLPGHGAPGGPELCDAMQHYLSVARDLFSKAKDGADLKARLIAAFPDFGGRVLLDHQQRFLFPAKKS